MSRKIDFQTANVVVRQAGSVLMIGQTNVDATPGEWQRIADANRSWRERGGRRTLVVSHGATLDATQRKEVMGNFAVGERRLVVLTSSPLARAAGIAVGWFVPSLRIFGLDELHAGLDFMDIDPSERADQIDVYAGLQALLRIKMRRSIPPVLAMGR